MATVAFALSLCVAAVGAVGIVSPRSLLGFVRLFHGPAGPYAASVFRLVLDGALVLAAPTSRASGVGRILGLVILVAGVLTPIIGVARFRRLLDCWAARGPALIHFWAAVALLFGLLLALAVVAQ